MHRAGVRVWKDVELQLVYVRKRGSTAGLLFLQKRTDIAEAPCIALNEAERWASREDLHPNNLVLGQRHGCT